MKRILIPVDFSDTSLNALNVACQMAARVDADVYLLHVNEMSPVVAVSEFDLANSAVNLEEYYKQLRTRMQDLKNNLLEKEAFQQINIHTAIREGRMISVITEMVDEEQIDLIVIGTLGASGWKEALIGSNTERVVRYANCPVLVIPMGTHTFNLERVLVSSTLKPDQKAVFKLVKAWQSLFGFETHIIYVNDPLNTPTHGSIEAEKNRIVEEAGLRNAYLHIFGMTMNGESAIRSYAAEMEADLIFMGTHQRRGISHLLFGSVTEDAVNHTEVPILAVPI